MEFLPRLDGVFDQRSPSSSSGECPSLTDSFLSNHPIDVDRDFTRRSSSASSPSTSPGWYSTKSALPNTPTTPLTAMSTLDMVFARPKVEPGMHRNEIYRLSGGTLSELDCWMTNEDTADAVQMAHLSTIPMTDVLDIAEQSMLCQLQPQYSETLNPNNPALSRSIFDLHNVVSNATPVGEVTCLPWATLTSSPPQTIAPSAAFQQVLMSSPIVKFEPSTPLGSRTRSSLMLSSSPISLMSTPMLASQYDVEETGHEFSDHDLDFSRTPRHRGPADRLQRRVYERKRNLVSSSRPKPVPSRSGMDCNAVIAENEWPCTYPGCIDKTTGKQKRFGRREHAKRHENTVHRKTSAHRCWVPECTTGPFTRTDNLRSHLKKTHGKKSANQRNRYVATQDENSEHYDPDWIGDLTKDGYPIC
jgi:hypothetical protein